MKSYLRASFCFLLLSLFACCPPSETDRVDFIILQLNDVYEIAPIEGGKAAGMARVATIRKQLLAENPNVITTLSGDFLSPSLTGTLTYKDEKIAGKHMVEVMNALGVDYVIPGNHEYDISEQDHMKRIAESEFIWTTTNCWHVVNGESVPWTQKGKTFPDHIMHTIDGVDIAFFGPTVPNTIKPFVSYTPKYQSAKKVYKKIKDEAEVLVAITHLEEEMDSLLATEHIPELDLILGGHDHTNMLRQYGKTIMTKADANAKTVYIHRLSYNKATRKTTIKSELVTIDDSIVDDPEVKKVVDKWVAISDSSLASLGYNTKATVLDTKNMPDNRKVLDGRETSIRNEPTNYPIMTAEAFLHVTNADLAIFNSGSLRLDDQLTGIITEYDILRSFPFGGGISTVSLKGDVVRDILDAGKKNAGTGGYLQHAKVTGDIGAWVIDGTPLSTTKTYKLALPDYVMEGSETGLGFLSKYTKDATKPNLDTLKNDVRDIVMVYFRSLNK
ncbi:MAG: 5'-nucleotidase C-terminal domain-containing protein [Roseivirga sp.]